MDKVKLIQKVNKAIAELEEIREELMSEFPDFLEKVTMGEFLKDRASIRVINALGAYKQMYVKTFITNYKRSDTLTLRNFGKVSMLELSRIIKEETGIDW